ncbi:MAG: ribosomal L7Ae/L30e/S12e/Gadd45 family protein [Clostridioides sp.]|nr:ribosomal L7Ae/L30e/S12e/Gadd45 family protein [Clostridioides sp.]
MMINKKAVSLIGLAMRAGKVVSGDDTTLIELKKNKLKLVIIAEDASDNTKKLFKDKSSYRQIPYVICMSKNEIGLMIGKSPRAVMGIKDRGFADKIKSLLEEK